MNATTRNADRYAWVDFAKGFCIVAVVAMWVTEVMQGHQAKGQAGWLGYFVVFAKPFRMPDFFLISGLFLSRVINRPWRDYLDTKVVHYWYFFLLWTVITVPLSWALGYQETATPVALPSTVGEAVSEVLLRFYEPFGMLWFIMMLSVYFVATRLLHKVSPWVVMPAAVALMVFPLETGIYHIDRFGVFFGFFYAGHIFASRIFALADWAAVNRRTVMVAVLVWAVCNGAIIKLGYAELFAMKVVLGFAGISAVVVISRLVADQPWASVLRYLGQNSIVVYLGFFLPMVALLRLLQASPVAHNPHIVGTLTWVGAIAIAVGFSRVAQRIGLGFLYDRPQWLRLKKPATDGRSSARLGQA